MPNYTIDGYTACGKGSANEPMDRAAYHDALTQLDAEKSRIVTETPETLGMAVCDLDQVKFDELFSNLARLYHGEEVEEAVASIRDLIQIAVDNYTKSKPAIEILPWWNHMPEEPPRTIKLIEAHGEVRHEKHPWHVIPELLKSL